MTFIYYPFYKGFSRLIRWRICSIMRLRCFFHNLFYLSRLLVFFTCASHNFSKTRLFRSRQKVNSSGKTIYWKMDIMAKKIILSEAQLKDITKALLMENLGLKKVSKPYTISPDKVLIVKRYLDSSFKKGSYENIGANGFPRKERIVAMLSSNGEVLKNMYLEQVKDLLVDKFQKMFTDEDERDSFMTRVLDDWFEGKISPFGILPVNHLNESGENCFANRFEERYDRRVIETLQDFENTHNKCCPRRWTLIEPEQYKAALEKYMELGEAFNFPGQIIDGWIDLIISNILTLDACTILYGHGDVSPIEDVSDFYDVELENWDDCELFLERQGFYDWAIMPDRQSACTDNGLKQYYGILKEYSQNMSKGEKLIMINKLLHVAHWNGDLASCLIKGGSRACAKISGIEMLNESEKNFTTSNIGAEAKKTNTNPTEGQKHAGNYKKGHVVVRGMKITIEQPKGSYRTGKDANGKEWKQLMHNHYGYFTRTKGKDGDEVDVFLGPRLKSFSTVFVIDQNNGSREFDESKVMLGFDSEEKAKNAYLSNYEKGWNRIRKITGVPLDIFKEWLYRGRKQRQPFGDYVAIKRGKLNEDSAAKYMGTIYLITPISL